jgi:predicted metal-dependent phosphoesterase TrpH
MRRYDLHSHSTFSDGLLPPDQVVALAKQNGVDVLALTDHDCLDGLAQARLAAVEQGIQLVAGVEVSCDWDGRTIHVVGLNIDPDNPVLKAGLDSLQAVRRQRARDIAARLEKNGMNGAMEWTEHQLAHLNVTRTHFARYIVERGSAKNIQDAFNRYLAFGKPAYAKAQWATFDQAVGWINAAGGAAVVAHPGRYEFTYTKCKIMLDDFKTSGGAGIEVVYGGCDRARIENHVRLCKALDLAGSCGSDFHDPAIQWTRLGSLPPMPKAVTPIWADRF